MTISTKRVLLKKPLEGGFFKINKKYMSKFVEYLKETKTELRHVIWPSKNQTFYYTLIVIILSVVIAYYLGIFDFIFSKGLQKIITP